MAFKEGYNLQRILKMYFRKKLKTSTVIQRMNRMITLAFDLEDWIRFNCEGYRFGY
jgi:hypothetical protein